MVPKEKEEDLVGKFLFQSIVKYSKYLKHKPELAIIIEIGL